MSEKSKIASLKPARFVKMVAQRISAVKAAPDTDVPPLESYQANRIAAALHPKAQFLKVKEIVAHSPDFKTIVLEADREKGTDALAWFSAGQYLSVALAFDGMCLTRPYSLASAPLDAKNGEYRLGIKRVKDGLASNYLLDRLAVGDTLTASAPLGQFTYEPLRDAETVIGIAGGSGITPFRSFARAIADGTEKDMRLVLLYGSRTLADAVYADEIAALAEKCDRIKLVNVLSEEEKEGCESGFISADIIKKYAPENEAYSVFMCGPQAMYSFMDKELPKLGLRRKFIRRELFGEYFGPAKEADYPKDVQESYKLTVLQSGSETVVDCRSDASILRAMEAAGISAPADCRSGECGWCRSQLLSGDVYVPASVDGRRLADLDYGYIHPCCTFLLSDAVIEVPPAHA
ncbi:MAG: iron-sulfur cluster-binding domain-containing protein [Clostridia bacterium]|nr:iron-sulfur cluster-binding domain-containing protein [Clostridia bacterium]MBR0537638.1 iron-sulfur cluster-binding domain-containing protein [Clostridia bacterium]